MNIDKKLAENPLLDHMIANFIGITVIFLLTNLLFSTAYQIPFYTVFTWCYFDYIPTIPMIMYICTPIYTLLTYKK